MRSSAEEDGVGLGCLNLVMFHTAARNTLYFCCASDVGSSVIESCCGVVRNSPTDLFLHGGLLFIVLPIVPSPTSLNVVESVFVQLGIRLDRACA